MSVTELTHQEFTAERFEPFFRQAVAEGGLVLDANHFFRTWQLWMEMGLARVWANEGCLLGAIFTNDVFTEKLRAQVVYWFSKPEVRKSSVTAEVFRAFEASAREAGCADIQAASYEALDPIRRTAGHLKHGFRKTEIIFTKDLT